MNHSDPHSAGADAGSTLAQALRCAAAELNATALPDGLQARVLQAATAVLPAAPSATSPAPTASPRWLDAKRRKPGKPGNAPTRGAWWAWSGAVACTAVLCGSALLILHLPAPPMQEDDMRLGGFFLLVPPERWPAAGAAAPAWLVSTELPSERLAALGLPYDPAHAGDTVRAELLLHPSGDVLAVRFAR